MTTSGTSRGWRVTSTYRVSRTRKSTHGSPSRRRTLRKYLNTMVLKVYSPCEWRESFAWAFF